MEEKINVIFTSPALSMLQFENGNSISDQDGFLVGSFSEKVVKTVTDAEISKMTVEKVIYITNVIVVYDRFYDNTGKINVDAISNYLNSQDIIGWFRFRRNTELKPMLREKVIHKGLREFFKIPSDLFVLGLFTSSTVRNCATYTFSHAFYRLHSNKFVKTRMQISNLADSSDSYKTIIGPQSTKLNSILVRGSQATGINMVGTIQQEIDKYMNELIPIVSSLSKEEIELKNELFRLDTGMDVDIPIKTFEMNTETQNKMPTGSKRGRKAKKPK